LKPGGWLAMSFWSQYYRLLGCVRDRRWAAAREVLTARRGNITGTAVTFTWQTPAEVREILTTHGFAVDALVGIGVCSGIAEVGDALAPIAQPSRLGADDMSALMDLELAAGGEFAGNARYVLAVARKPMEAAA
jgi:hypothetical protein